ncbi:outer membrane protein assembly factor BamD [Endozoicomonas sp. ALD040]|uniref:outer membrane protein assembly factor BamD n=1 Tax=unclassified Endozoicomonas TaxID=2644528 RepID=UPI003BAEA24E
MTILKTTYSRLIFLILAAVVLAGCSSSPEKKTLPESLTEAELYQMANQSLNNQSYTKAVEYLRTLESRYPFGSFAEQAQLDLVYAYFMNVEPEAARAAADRFLRLHPQHPNADYAYYMKGLASNTASMGLIERYLPLDNTKRDPGQARQSFNEFRELLTRYPDSKYAPDARQRMVALRNRLADYEIHAANYYLKRKAYVAAVNRGKYVVENMQKTPAVEPALGIMVEGYQRLGLIEPANETLEVLKLNFPNSNLLNEQGEFIGYQSFGDVDPSLLYTVTFGLLGDSGIEKQKAQTPVAPQPPGNKQ